MNRQDCPSVAQHTPAPESYVGRQEWSAAMHRQGSRQRRCSACGAWSVWVGMKPPINPAGYERGCIAVRFGSR